MFEYARIYLKKRSAEYARILNVSDAVHSIRSLYKLLSSSRDRRIQNTVEYLRWSVFQGTGWGGVVDLGHFIYILSKTKENKAPQANISEFFLLDTLKATV